MMTHQQPCSDVFSRLAEDAKQYHNKRKQWEEIKCSETLQSSTTGQDLFKPQTNWGTQEREEEISRFGGDVNTYLYDKSREKEENLKKLTRKQKKEEKLKIQNETEATKNKISQMLVEKKTFLKL